LHDAEKGQNDYDGYMEGYKKNRSERWEHWKAHYDGISAAVLRSVVALQENGGVELIGVTSGDLKNGCVQLDMEYQGRTLADYLGGSSHILFHDISENALKGSMETFLSYNNERGKKSPPVVALQEDISRGVSGILSSILNGIDSEIGPGVESLIESLSGSFKNLKETRVVGVREQDRYPGVILGCSLMTLTATLVPLQEKMSVLLHTEAERKKYSPEKTQAIEERFFRFVEDYNNWLTSFWIQNWFQKNENGKILVAADYKKEYYKKDDQGVPNEKEIDSDRSYKTLDLTIFETLAEKGFEITELIKSVWNDEPDHRHLVGIFGIQKTSR